MNTAEQISVVIAKIERFAQTHRLSGQQLEQIFEMGSAAYQVSFGLPTTKANEGNG